MITDRELRLLGIVRRLAGMQAGRVPMTIRREPPPGVLPVARKLSPSRTHKASSAEAILRHCLRQHPGWLRRYRAGTLTQNQHRRLLDDVRLYAREWLRHEAEQFLKHHLGDARGLHGAAQSVLAVDGAEQPLPVSRKWLWVPDPRPDEFGQTGYVHGEDAGFFAGLNRFFGRVKTFVRETIVAGAMSLLGPDPLTGEEHDRAEAAARVQDAFLDRFKGEVVGKGAPAPRETKEGPQPVIQAPPPMTPKEFAARVELYGDEAHRAAQNINRAAAIKAGVFKVERLVLGKPLTEHCSQCPEDAAKGWQPIGSMAPIGERECRMACLCHFEYAVDENSRPYIQGKKGPLPAADLPRLEPDDGGAYPVAEPPGVTLPGFPVAGPPR